MKLQQLPVASYIGSVVDPIGIDILSYLLRAICNPGLKFENRPPVPPPPLQYPEVPNNCTLRFTLEMCMVFAQLTMLDCRQRVYL